MHVRSATFVSRSHSLVALGLMLAACPSQDARVAPVQTDASEQSERDVEGDAKDPRPETYSGLISLQHVAVHGLAAAGEGLNLQAQFTRAPEPTFDEQPGAPTGCKAYWYELPQRPPATPEDQGTITVRGLVGGPLSCTFAPGLGYRCSDGSAPEASARFLQRAFAPSAPIGVALAPGGEKRFEASESELQPGEAFVLDEASRASIANVPTDGSALTLGCSGAGGSCGEAQASIVRITTTDADLTGLHASAMPPPTRRYVEISCATLGVGSITVPGAAMQLLRRAREEGALTRIRTAFMRDGIALVAHTPPAPPSRLVIAAGHALLGFTDVPR